MSLDRKRLQWKLRRGMLELDILLDRFFEFGYEELSLDQRALFEELLESEDDQLFRLLMGHDETQNPQLKTLVKLIQAAVRRSES